MALTSETNSNPTQLPLAQANLVRPKPGLRVHRDGNLFAEKSTQSLPEKDVDWLNAPV